MRYQHYKGGYYQLLHEARHEKTGKAFAIYKAEKDGIIWARLWTEFFGMVEVDGKNVYRFRPVS